MKRPALGALVLLAFLLAGCPNQGPPDFRLSLSPSGVKVHQGETVETTLRVIPQNGFTGTLTLSWRQRGGAPLPAGLSISPSTVTVGHGTLETALSVHADAGTPVGSYNLELTAKKGALAHKASFSVTVVPTAGTLDEGFGTGGVVVLDTGHDDLGYSLAFGDGGAIYVLGRDNKYLWVRKFEDNGSPVSAFAGSGLLLLHPIRPLGTTERDNDLDHALIPLLGGSFLAGGYAYDVANDQDDLLLAKFDASGNPDTDFGSDGIQTYDNLLYSGSGYANERAYSLARGSDGKVWVAGFAYKDATDIEQALAMKVDLAAPDNPELTDLGGSGSEYAYTVTPLDGGAFFAGTTNEGGLKGGWLRVDQNLTDLGHGELPAFAGGRVTSSALDAEGRILLAGYTYNGSDYDVVVVRMYPDGTLDTSFDADGIVQLDNLGGSGGSDRAFSLAIDGEGRILVAGRTFVSGHGDDLLVLRLQPDGSLDTSFGDGGVFLWDGNGHTDGAFEVALDGRGRIVVTGFSDNGSDNDLVLLRLNP